MPSLSKLILLSTLLLSGALSLPTASPGNIGIGGSPGFSLTRDSKREASPAGIHGGGTTRGGKREAEAEAAPGGIHGGGTTRGGKREES